MKINIKISEKNISFSGNFFFLKIEIGQKIKIIVKNQNFGKKSIKFWSEVEISVKKLRIIEIRINKETVKKIKI